MTDLNSVIIEGEVTARIEGEITVAVTRTYKGADGRPMNEVSYFNVVADEFIEKFYNKTVAELKRGDKVRIVGRLGYSKWYEHCRWYEKVFVVAEQLNVWR